MHPQGRGGCHNRLSAFLSSQTNEIRQKISEWRAESQSPFGFFVFSDSNEIRQKISEWRASHNRLSAFLSSQTISGWADPASWAEKSQSPFGFFVFSDYARTMKAGQWAMTSQSPFGFFVFSDRDKKDEAAAASSKSQSPFGFFVFSDGKVGGERFAGRLSGHNRLSAFLSSQTQKRPSQ